MKELKLFRCNACCTLSYADGGSPWHDVSEVFACESFAEALDLLTKAIAERAKELKMNESMWEINSVKREGTIKTQESKCSKQ